MPQKKSLDQLRKEIKTAEEDKKRKKLEAKLRQLKSSGKGKKIKKGIAAALDRAGRNFGFE